jgi:hypothetical protein
MSFFCVLEPTFRESLMVSQFVHLGTCVTKWLIFVEKVYRKAISSNLQRQTHHRSVQFMVFSTSVLQLFKRLFYLCDLLVHRLGQIEFTLAIGCERVYLLPAASMCEQSLANVPI